MITLKINFVVKIPKIQFWFECSFYLIICGLLCGKVQCWHMGASCFVLGSFQIQLIH